MVPGMGRGDYTDAAGGTPTPQGPPSRLPLTPAPVLYAAADSAILRGPYRARSSAVEHYLDMVGVTGSIPVAPTSCKQKRRQSFDWCRFCFGAQFGGSHLGIGTVRRQRCRSHISYSEAETGRSRGTRRIRWTRGRDRRTIICSVARSSRQRADAAPSSFRAPPPRQPGTKCAPPLRQPNGHTVPGSCNDTYSDISDLRFDVERQGGCGPMGVNATTLVSRVEGR